MRFVAAGSALWLALGVSLAAPLEPVRNPPGAAPPVPPITQAEAHHFSDQITQASRVIVEYYARPVEQHVLVAKALVALHEAAQVPLPDMLQGDAAKALAGRDLFAEAMKIRRALGSPLALRAENAIRISLQTMVALLDPYSTYLGEEDWQQRTNQRLGIGMTLKDGPSNGTLLVKSVVLGGPAVEKGIWPGDGILEINGESTRLMTAAAATENLLGPAETALTLLIQPLGKPPSKAIQFARRPFREETVLGVQRSENGTWEFLIDRQQRIAHVRLGNLLEGTSEELLTVLAGLRESGMKGLVLDLRDCPGGLLDEATSVVQCFIHGGIVAKVKYREEEETLNVFRQNSHAAFPMVALIGPETSGGGELIAAALQDHQRAAIAGQRSRGKASIQRTPSLGLGGHHSIRLTVGYFFRPNGKNLHRHPDSKPNDPWGVAADAELEVRLSTQLRQQIRDWRLLQDLRPPGARRALPLDDPDADPVLLTARAHLQKQLR